ncbi:MAG: PD40 domain-containing protein [Acidobacteria bacterium]|nr:PD40 domain-containing protein [Acidobacteriota bacterium]
MPRWSPDGRRIAFFSNRSGAQNIWVVDADGSGLGQLTDSSDTMFYPVWSPDGSRMAVSSARGVYIFDPARPWRDQKPEALPPMEAGRAFVVNSWSADRRWLAGDVGVPSSGIARYSFETRGYERLTDFGEWPVWLGDNRRIMFVSGGKTLHIIDVGTKKVHDVLTVTREVLAPPRVTRDGRTVYFSRRTTEADVWLLELK